MSSSYLFYMILLWIGMILVSVVITLIFDWHYPKGKQTRLSFWRHWWHAPLLLLLTLMIGLVLGFGLTPLQEYGFPPGPDGFWESSISLMILWSITFSVIHVLWLNWQIRSLK